MKCRHIIATFIFALIAVFAISFISIDTARAETLYSQDDDIKLTLLPNTLTSVTGVDNGLHTSGEIILTGVSITVKTNTTENRLIRQRTGNRLLVSPQGISVYNLLLQSGTTTVAHIARADYSGSEPVYAAYALEIKFETVNDRVQFIQIINQNELFRNLYVVAEQEAQQYYSRTQYDTRYIPQYPNVTWRTSYINIGTNQLEEVTNSYNRQTGVLTFTVPANINNDLIVHIGKNESMYIWEIADMTLQANIRHYKNTGSVGIEYTDTENGPYQQYITDFYTQPQLNTYLDMSGIDGNKYLRQIYFRVPPSTEPQTITLSLGQGMYMKGYISARENYRTELQAAYGEGYTAGRETAQSGDWVHLMTALWDVPMSYINGLFDVTILGINLKELFKAVVLIALTAAIIKRFI